MEEKVPFVCNSASLEGNFLKHHKWNSKRRRYKRNKFDHLGWEKKFHNHMKHVELQFWTFQEPASGVHFAEGGNVYRRLTGALVHPSHGVTHHAEGCMTLGWWWQCRQRSPWGTSSTPLYLCLPPIRGSAGGGCYFPTMRGRMEKFNKNKPLKGKDSLLQTHLYRLSTGPAMQADYPRRLASPANLGKLCKK
jgi:hypothetical protein